MNSGNVESKANIFNKVYVLKEGERLDIIKQKIFKIFKNSDVSIQKTIVRSGGIYFDTPELSLLTNDRQLRIQLNEYFSKEKKIKIP